MNMQNKINIIIPSWNAFDILAKTLATLQSQTIPRRDICIIVVDDNSNSKPPRWLRSMVDIWLAMPQQSGPSLCRNEALRSAPASLATCFLGQDTVATNKFLEEHLITILDSPRCASLGGIYFPPEYIEDSVFMAWLEEQPYQFDYINIRKHGPRWFHSYTSNLMVPTELIPPHPFDWDRFPYLFEDIDFGYKLAKQGVKLVYTDAARVTHYHVRTIDEFLRRQELAGSAAFRFTQKYKGEIDPDLFAVKTILSKHSSQVDRQSILKYVKIIESSKRLDIVQKAELAHRYELLLRSSYAVGVHNASQMLS